MKNIKNYNMKKIICCLLLSLLMFVSCGRNKAYVVVYSDGNTDTVNAVSVHNTNNTMVFDVDDTTKYIIPNKDSVKYLVIIKDTVKD